jgi:uncharacterized protein
VTGLVDINLLIALLWERHEHHRAARRWFGGVRRFATCPLTQLGFVRISSNPAIGYALEVAVAREVLRALTKHPRHTFWADGIGVLDRAVLAVVGASQLTDAYLLGLAVRRRGYLATLDQGIARWAGAAADRVETLQLGASRA